MGIFDLLLIASVLGTLGGALIAIVLWIYGRRQNAKWILLILGGYLTLYAVALVATSIFSAQRQVPMGEQQRFDDWCLCVENVVYENDQSTTRPENDGIVAVVTVEVSNRGRGRAQSEPGTFLYVVDDQGRTYWQSVQAQEEYERIHETSPLITSMISAGKSIVCKQVFELPCDARHPEVIIGRPFGPGAFVIGDSDSFFHKKSVVPLPDLPPDMRSKR
ncbi:MAG: hypothetical protein M3O30_10805 [Planctomycetota bacterium]|nr:hypothetical protein [Planctomycetota bacterium]